MAEFLTRRKLLWGLIAAPAVVRAASLMPVRAWIEEAFAAAPVMTIGEYLTETLRARAGILAQNVTRNNALLQRLKEKGAIYSGYEPIVWHEEELGLSYSWAEPEIERIRAPSHDARL